MTIQEQGFAPQPTLGPEPVETISITVTGPRELLPRFRDALDIAYGLVIDLNKNMLRNEREQITITGEY